MFLILLIEKVYSSNVKYINRIFNHLLDHRKFLICYLLFLFPVKVDDAKYISKLKFLRNAHPRISHWNTYNSILHTKILHFYNNFNKLVKNIFAQKVYIYV